MWWPVGIISWFILGWAGARILHHVSCHWDNGTYKWTGHDEVMARWLMMLGPITFMIAIAVWLTAMSKMTAKKEGNDIGSWFD